MFTMLRVRRLRWTGHVRRLEDGRFPKDIFYGALADAPRPRGRPRLRFKDVLMRDLAAFGIPVATWETGALLSTQGVQILHRPTLIVIDAELIVVYDGIGHDDDDDRCQWFVTRKVMQGHHMEPCGQPEGYRREQRSGYGH